MTTKEFIEKIPFSSGCEVANFDGETGLIAINKKAGRAAHPNPKESAGAKPPMVRARYNFKDEYYSWDTPEGEYLRMYLINRIDSPTSGLILASDNAAAAAAAKEAFKNKTVEKTYFAICVGRLSQLGGTWADTIIPRKSGNFVRATVGASGRRAETDFEFADYDVNGANLTLLKLRPKTGITHQLRIQCSKRGFPILGDATYGNFAFNKRFRTAAKINRLFLHCAKTSLKIVLNGKEFSFSAEAALPQSFKCALLYNKDILTSFKI